MNCDRIAHWYRPLEYLVFGRALEKRRFEYLGQVGEVRNALILGDGDGRFTAEFVQALSAGASERLRAMPVRIKQGSLCR